MLCNFEGIKTPNLYYIYSLYSYHNFSKIALMRRVMSAERTRRNHSLISTWYLSILNLRACPPNLDVVASKRKPFKAAGIASFYREATFSVHIACALRILRPHQPCKDLHSISTRVYHVACRFPVAIFNCFFSTCIKRGTPGPQYASIPVSFPMLLA
jgi:hypothetical protein